MASKAAQNTADACACGGKHLTDREIDILVRSAAGMNACQIAASLQISRRTVEYHIAAILHRTAAKNTVEAVARCYVIGVLRPEEWPPQWSGQLCLQQRRSPGPWRSQPPVDSATYAKGAAVISDGQSIPCGLQ